MDNEHSHGCRLEAYDPVVMKNVVNVLGRL